MSKTNSLGFIGLGNMGLALLKGYSESGRAGLSLFGYDADVSKRKIAEEYAACLNSEVEIAENCKYILLAVKPQTVPEVLEKIKPALDKDSVIISICAGISAEFIRARTFTACKVVQVMPNTPMMLRLGASTIAISDGIGAEEITLVKSIIMSCSPVVKELSPNMINSAIGANGSFPAFAYLIAECHLDYVNSRENDSIAVKNSIFETLISFGEMLKSSEMSYDQLIASVCLSGGTPFQDLEALLYLVTRGSAYYAETQNIDPDVFICLISQTLIGSGHMLLSSGMSPEKLIAQVCSPGGTTEKGLNALRDHEFPEMARDFFHTYAVEGLQTLEKYGFGVEEAVLAYFEACTARAYELSKG